MSNFKSIPAMVANYMSRYDHNRDGVLDIKRPAGVWKSLTTRDERVRSTTMTTPAMEEDKVNLSTTYHTIDRLLYAADKDSNGHVTPEELTATIGRYDQDKDGRLSYRGFLDTLRFRPREEGDEFERELGERVTHHTNMKF